MSLDLVLSPTGHVHVRDAAPADASPAANPWLERVARAFEAGQAPGLFALGAERPAATPPPAFAFWRTFAVTYLSELCRLPEDTQVEPIEPPAAEQLAALVDGAPPMLGAEYLSAPGLSAIWHDLDAWVHTEIASSKAGGLTGFLARRAPLWHAVGRVCFHLAENKSDPARPFAFLATYAPHLSAAGRVQYQPLSHALHEYAGARNKRAMVRLLSPVQRASEVSALVKKLLDSGDIFHPLAWTPKEAHAFLRDCPLYEESGLLVRVPDWWKRRPRPAARVVVGDQTPSRFGVDALLDFRVDVALGDERLTRKELRQLLQGEEGLVLLKGQWVEVDRERLSEALAHWEAVEEVASGDGISFIDGMRLLAGAPAGLTATGGAGGDESTSEWSSVRAGRWLGEMLASLRDPARLDAVQSSGALRATLRPYQVEGLNWLWFLTHLGLGACLADDMGLGKTVQVIALLLALREEGRPPPKTKKARAAAPRRPSLVVAPASLLANWKAEIERFAPDLEARFVHRSETDRATLAAMAEAPSRAFAETDVVLTTYGMLAREAWLHQQTWRIVVLDEAQAIKNPSARQTRAVKQLESDARIALTGTPVENRLSDLWSLYDFLCPGLLGNATRFKAFVKSLDKRDHDRYAPLRKLIRPYLLRRLKTDPTVIQDLPEKTETRVFCGLARKQAALYQRSVDELAKALRGAEGIQRRGLVLSFLMRMKQICNHPSQWLGDGGYDPRQSGKFDRLRAIAEEIAARQEKALVFTQFKEMTGPLAAFLSAVFGRDGLTLHGGTPVARRRRLIDSFQQEEGPPFFVLSLKAGGTGLNLTAASHVIHFDRWWNPAVENQATDRAFRIGQKRNVLVHKFICRGTIEEMIDAMIGDKLELARDLVEGGAERLLTELGDEELVRLVSLDLNRAGV